jgi:O-antigen/teichoic acid export membrane protein
VTAYWGKAGRSAPRRALQEPIPVNAITTAFTWLRDCAFRFASREHVLALADQAVVSGTSFLTTLAIARWSDAGQLGIYAVGISLLVSLLAFQDSLILQPYSIQRYYPEGRSNERAGAALALSLLFSAGSILVMSVIALGFLEWGANPGLCVVTWAIAAIVPFALTRDFARRFDFARLEMGRAFLLDLATAILQLFAVVGLGMSGRMSAPSACAAVGGATALATFGWLYWTRAEFTIRLPHVQTTLKQIWKLGKWLLVGRITGQVQSSITYWLSMAALGAVSTGVFAACMSIVSFANPLLLGLGNALMPRSVVAWKNGGGPALWRETIRNTILFGALLTPFSLAIILAGEAVMRFLYHGSEFEGQGHTLIVLALTTVWNSVGVPPTIALATMERPRAIVINTTVGVFITVGLVWLLMTQWGLLGAAYGLLASGAVGAVGRWLTFFLLVPRVSDPAPVMRALQEFTSRAGDREWQITPLGSGLHAETFLMQSDEPAVWGNERSLVAKLYKPSAALTLEMVQAQFDSLLKLHAVLDGRTIEGWTVSVPKPVYICKTPLALVMTEVPGRHIDFYASKDEPLTSKILTDTSKAFVMAMQQCWSIGLRHGDLGVHNAIFDVEAKQISFIDTGTRESCPVCSDYSRSQSAAAFDLAHVLYDVALDVMDLLGRPTMRVQREAFVENVLHTAIRKLDSLEEKRKLLNEIINCVEQHLTGCLNASWSLRGVWYGFVRQIATQRISSIIDRVVSQSNINAGQSRNEFHRGPRYGR